MDSYPTALNIRRAESSAYTNVQYRGISGNWQRIGWKLVYDVLLVWDGILQSFQDK